MRLPSVTEALMALNREHLARRLEELRGLHHFTIRDAAAHAHVSERQWVRIEQKQVRWPRPDTLEKITRAYHLSDGDLLGLEPGLPQDYGADLARVEAKIDAILDHLGIEAAAIPAPPGKLVDDG